MREYLCSIPFFSSLDDDALDLLIQRLQRKHVHRGASVFLAGEPGDCMYLIQSGLVKIISHYEKAELVDTMLNEHEIMEGEIIRSRMHPVDVVIQPDVARYYVRQYDRAPQIIPAGEEAACLQIPYIRKLLAPRPRKPRSD